MSKRTEVNRGYERDTIRYTVGFGSALGLVYLMYFAVVDSWFSGVGLAGWLLGCAGLQLFVQLWVFLHITDEQKPRWNLWSLLYVGAMLLIVVAGSLWIMANMNYNMHMTPEQMHDFMAEQNRKGF